MGRKSFASPLKEIFCCYCFLGVLLGLSIKELDVFFFLRGISLVLLFALLVFNLCLTKGLS